MEPPCSAGTVPTIWVWDLEFTDTAELPKSTAGESPKLVPVRVITEPPAVEMVLALRLLIVGAS